MNNPCPAQGTPKHLGAAPIFLALTLIHLAAACSDSASTPKIQAAPTTTLELSNSGFGSATTSPTATDDAPGNKSDEGAKPKVSPDMVEPMIDLEGRDLRQIDLQNRDITGIRLAGADLSGANLVMSQMNDANLDRANLTGANLAGAGGSWVYFNGAILRGANLTGSDFRMSNFCGAAPCFDGATCPQRLDLRSAILANGTFSHSTFEFSDLTDVDARNSDFSFANFANAILSNADLTGANFQGAELLRADFTGVKLDSISWKESFEGATFSETIWVDGSVWSEMPTFP
jgi:uncharacterized protein YjbI with pentapeptide repeats